MIKNKKILIIVGVIILIIAIILLSYFFLFKKVKQSAPAPLTQEQKVQMLDQLGKGADTSPAGLKKQQDALLKLQGNVPAKPLTDEQKQKIMNSFNNL